CRPCSTGRFGRWRSSATPAARPPARSAGSTRRRTSTGASSTLPAAEPGARLSGCGPAPAVSGAGREYFGMEDNPNLTVYDADARPFLRRTDERYDLIIVDAYHQPYVPFYLATREFFRLARERLAPGGIVALNVAAVPGDESLLDGIAGTL